MGYTFGQLKADIRRVVFPAREASNLVEAHNKDFVDAMVNLQRWVKCAQIDHTDIRPHCSTYYKCGLTITDAPQGIIVSVSIVDRLDPVTGKEDATVGTDWCSKIKYTQVDPCCMNQFMSLAAAGYGCSIPLFFGLSPGCCGGSEIMFLPPTDEGVDSSLPKLPLGFHYPQVSTDRKYGRARGGRWAIERGRILIAPWIQSTEAVLIEWDGIKMTWADGDPVNPSAMLIKAVTDYVRWQHHEKWERDYSAAGAARAEFEVARQEMIYDCRQQTRVRECEGSQARGSQPTALYYNTEQSYTAQCQEGTTGANVTVTIQAGTIGSVVSVADANQQAQDEAKQQATDRLDCTANTPTFTNDQRSATAYCTGGTGAPQPDGNPKTVIVPAGTFTSKVSKEDANAQALAAAQSQAAAQLSCTYWNSAQTASCPSGQTGTPVTIPAHSYSSSVSQEVADALALNAAQSQLSCSGGSFKNTEQKVKVVISGCSGHPHCQVSIFVTVPANLVSSSISQADANQQAQNLGNNYGSAVGRQKCSLNQCGSYPITLA